MNATGHVLIGVEKRGSYVALCLCGHTETATDQALATAKLYSHIIHAKRPCPSPHKKQYPSREHAENAVSKFLRATGPGYRPTRAYQCVCGLWHTTKQPAPSRKGAA